MSFWELINMKTFTKETEFEAALIRELNWRGWQERVRETLINWYVV